MSRVLTLRGTVSCADNAIQTNRQIFSNESNNLNKAWLVEGCWMWPQTIRAATGTGDGRITMAGSLATDDGISSASFGPQATASDNRQIAWCMNEYQLRDAATDFLARNSASLVDNRFLIDPGHLVTTGLFINMYVTSDNATSPTRDWNYMVVLREKKVNPTEAILSIVKAIAQDIDN